MEQQCLSSPDWLRAVGDSGLKSFHYKTFTRLKHVINKTGINTIVSKVHMQGIGKCEQKGRH